LAPAGQPPRHLFGLALHGRVEAVFGQQRHAVRAPQYAGFQGNSGSEHILWQLIEKVL
jgi:uncharacterized cupin superfamily protein